MQGDVAKLPAFAVNTQMWHATAQVHIVRGEPRELDAGRVSPKRKELLRMIRSVAGAAPKR